MYEIAATPLSQPTVALAGVLTNTSTTTSFAESINAAATDLYGKLATRRLAEHKNFVFFTPNMLAAFSMLLAGAPEEPKAAIEAFLRVGSSGDNWHQSFGTWIEGLASRSVESAQSLAVAASKADKMFFKQAQAVLARKDITIPEATGRRLESYRPTHIPFASNEEAKQLTNDWVSKNTDGKITQLVETLPDETVLMLVTAALFEGRWKFPFKESENSQEVFHNSDGSKVMFTQMNQGLDELRLYSDWEKGVEICEFPFYGDVAMWVVKCGGGWNPNGAEMASQLTAFMTPENVQGVINNSTEFRTASALSVGIPKIKITDKMDAFEVLATDPLVKSIVSADWNGSLVNCNDIVTTKQLVSEVQFQMDEAGTSIAAATYSPSGCESCDPTFQVNGPFGVVLIDQKNSTILGMGQFNKLEGAPAKARSW